MGKRIINTVTLLAFIVYSICGTGCTSITRIPIDEISTVPEKKITQLTLNDGAHVNVSDRPTEYDYSSEKFLSALPDGAFRTVRAGQVDSVYFTTESNPQQQLQPYSEFRSDESKRLHGQFRGVIRGVSTGFTDYEFDKHHGRIDSLNNAVFGFSKDGDSVYVSFDNITTLKVRRTSVTKTALLVVGLGMLGLVIGVGIAMQDGLGFGYGSPSY